MRCPNCGAWIDTISHVACDWFIAKLGYCPSCTTHVQMNYSDNPSVRKLGWKRRTTTVPALRAEDV